MDSRSLTLSHLYLSVQAIVSLLLLNPTLWGQAPHAPHMPRTPLKILGSSRTQDGLRGPVRRVQTEVARLAAGADDAAGQPRTLLEVTLYDASGQRIENETYPVAATTVGRETYKYDEQGQLAETITRDARGAVLSRTVYTYEFDAYGNWTTMTASAVVTQAGEMRLEPAEITYRTITYYADGQDGHAVLEGHAATPEPSKMDTPTSDGRAQNPAEDVALGAGASAPAAGQYAEVGEINDKALSLPTPAYPIGGRRAKRPITVTVMMTIDETGRILSAVANEGPQELRRAAEAAARQAVFLPFRVGSQPVKARGLLRYTFPYAPE